jgi:chromosome segregation ATPase
MKRELTRTVAAVPAPSRLVEAARDIKELAQNPKFRRVLQEANQGVASVLAGAQDAVKEHQDRIAELALENGKLRSQVRDLAEKMRQAEREKTLALRKLEAVRDHLRPQWEALYGLFNALGDEKPTQDRSVWEPWLQKAGKRGCKRMLEVLIEKRELTRNQLGTLSNVASTKSTFRNYLSWLKTNGLVEVNDDSVRLRAV